MDVAEEDAVGTLAAAPPVVEGQRDDVLHVLGVLEGLDGRVQVALVRQVDALEDSPLRVQQVAVVVPAAHAILGQHAVGTGAGPLSVPPVQAQLLAVSIVLHADVGTWDGGEHKHMNPNGAEHTMYIQHHCFTVAFVIGTILF